MSKSRDCSDNLEWLDGLPPDIQTPLREFVCRLRSESSDSINWSREAQTYYAAYLRLSNSGPNLLEALQRLHAEWKRFYRYAPANYPLDELLTLTLTLKLHPQKLGHLLKKQGAVKALDTLTWAIDADQLDVEWRERAVRVIKWILDQRSPLFDGRMMAEFQALDERADHLLFYRVLKPSTEIAFWKIAPCTSPCFQHRIPEVGRDPFPRSPRAEHDWTLPKTFVRVMVPEIELLNSTRNSSLMIAGSHGSGKTAMAIWLVWDCLKNSGRGKKAFSVYYGVRGVPTDLEVQSHLATVLACFLAVQPEAFANAFTDNQYGMRELLLCRCGSQDDLEGLLKYAGMQNTKGGRDLFDDLVKNGKYEKNRQSLPESKLREIFSVAFPRGFNGLRLIFDWVGEDPGPDEIQKLCEIQSKYSRRGVDSITFLTPRDPDCLPPGSGNLDQAWNPLNLTALLNKRLQVSGFESLKLLLDDAWHIDLDRRLVSQSHSPRDLVSLGWRLIEAANADGQYLLTAQRVDLILPESTPPGVPHAATP